MKSHKASVPVKKKAANNLGEAVPLEISNFFSTNLELLIFRIR